MKKNLIVSILVLCLCMGTLVGCANSGEPQSIGNNAAGTDGEQAAGRESLSIVCTVFPQYDWVREILGDREKASGNAELTLLLDNGVDLHSYQPTAEDIARIATCDLFIYVGGESDGWVADALAEATNKDMKVINMMEVLGDGIKEEEVVEGMEAEEEEGEEGEEAEAEYDEHVWLSLKNAEVICKAISGALSEIDTENKALYEKNLAAYTGKLEALDEDYQKAVDGAARTTLLFGDRFPFRYLVDNYGLDYYAAFVGCSAETEASFETIVFLAGKTDELSLPAVCVLESSDQSIAKTIINNTKNKGQKILVMDSMQSVTSEDVAKGATYLSIMEENLEVLKEALN
ncbi:MAG TPA: zinc ABC transporter substrate-binding protein [Clostridiales bacterium]|nr:zinc ABC transporter substrate-binding protein [Clostridiales bacterium]